MNKSWINAAIIIYSLVSSLSLCAEEEERFYKYKDSQGNVMISNSLPPEAANQGYEIISPRGNVLEKVPPRKSDQEIARDQAIQKRQEALEAQTKAKEEQEKIQAQKDEILLKSFSSEADIKRSRDDKILAIATLQKIIQDNITRLQKQLNEARAMVENLERNKEPIPVNLKKTIEDTQRQIKENEAFLKNKEMERTQINTTYQQLIDRFNQLYQQESNSNPSN